MLRPRSFFWLVTVISGVGIILCLIQAGTVAALIGFALLLAAGIAGVQGRFVEGTALDRQEPRAALYEKQLQRQKADIDGFADGLDMAVFICDSAGIIQYANRAATEMFSFPRPVGRSLLAVTLSHTLEDLVARALASKMLITEELQIRTREITTLCRVWPEPIENQRAFVTLYDISNVRRLERVRQDFVANVSHELRTPLTSIRAMSEIMSEVSPDETVLRSRYLSQIIREVDRLTNIVNDLLTLSTAESRDISTDVIDFSYVVSDVVSKLENKAREKKLVLNQHIEPHLDILANATQISQVVFNLLDNALNYTVEGSVTLRLEAVGNKVRLSVSDTGIGIGTEHQNRVFERFYRIDKGRSRAGGGTGLGLSIVKHIVEAHGGTIELESTLHEGSTFIVWLPLIPASQSELEDPSNDESSVTDA